MTTGKTGERCEVSGIYRCFGHNGVRVTVWEGEIFPRCTEDHAHEAIWILVKKV
ncbi:MAG TPA: hypothetical protein VF145_04305 [Chitinophagaceae bacterium]